MKGKNRIKIIIPMVVGMLVVACIAFCLPNLKSKVTGEHNRVVNAVYVDNSNKKVSAKFGGDILFSVEKGYVGSGLENTTTFATNSGDYVFESASVVEDNTFVKLDNIYDGTYHREGNENVEEVIIVSLGKYVLNNDKIYTNTEKNAGITYLDIVTATHNGTDIADDFQVRSVNSGNTPVLDLMLEIKQSNTYNNEGYYFFTFNYLVGGVEYTESFEFYLVFDTSYTGTQKIEDVQYTAKPTIFVNDETDEYSVETFCVGEDGVDNTDAYSNYPTLCFDYTRYHVSYTHTSNRKVTTYDFEHIVNGARHQLVMTASNSDGTFTRTFDIDNYDGTRNTNLATLLLTEKGTYQFSYEYIYVGYSASEANLPEMNLDKIQDTLVIHGFETMYSKVNFAGAELKYLKLVENTGVDLIVPNGYNYDTSKLDDNASITTLENEKLDFCYSLETNNEDYKAKRNGTIIETASQNPLINGKLKRTEEDKKINSNNYYDYLLAGTGSLNVKNYDNLNNLTTILDSFSESDYVKTNQGSVWFEYNDDFDADNSFYFYSASKLTGDNLFDADNDTTAISYTNTTSFNKTGYYLVFIKLKYDTTSYYYQIFAFRYATSTVDIEVADTNSKTIGAGGYTNSSVTVRWKSPDVFEKKLTAYLYTSKNVNLTSTSGFTNPQKISNITTADGYDSVVVGTDVTDGNFVQYMVNIKSEGENSTSKIFTIDKQPISDVKVYAVKKLQTTDGRYYYELARDTSNNYIDVKNAITDSFATLDYANKASGAGISAVYSFAQFVSNTSVGTRKVNDMLVTDYKLGDVVEGLTDFVRRDDDESILNTNSVLTEQGIYLFTLTDAAGNSCKYMFVIDETEAYFEICKNGEYSYTTSDSLIYTQDVGYNVYSYKAINTTTTNETLQKIITSKTFDDNYYTQDNEVNKNNIKSLFATISGQTYLKVKNLKVYDNDVKHQELIGLSGTLTATDGNSSFYELRIYGENDVYSGEVKENDSTTWNSYLEIEINPDNSQGFAYYCDTEYVSITNWPTGKDEGDKYRLRTGSNLSDEYLWATSAGYVYFVCMVGTGTIHKIASLTYEFYPLDTASGLYNASAKTSGTLYADNSLGTNVTAISNDRIIYKFGVKSSNSGLYVVTRTYEQEATGNDVTTKKYYFIVDRNEVYTTDNAGTALIGNAFSINMLNGSTVFNEFEKTSTTTSKFTYEDATDTFTDEEYVVSLSTNKLPATINVPKAKYYNAENGSNEWYSGQGLAGQLKVKLFFVDKYLQIDADSKTITKIFDSTKYDLDSVDESNGIYKFSIESYLKNAEGEATKYYQKLVAESSHGNWLSLPGEYILVIQDNVLSTSQTNHQKIIAFKIEKDTAGPTLDIVEGYDDDASLDLTDDEVYNELTTATQTNYQITTNKDIVAFKISAYDNTSVDAQVDTDYLIIKRQYNNSTDSKFVNYKYTSTNDGTKQVGKDTTGVIIADDGGWIISLPTTFNDIDGEYNWSDKLVYTITIRYRLNETTSSKPELAMTAYYYYNDNSSYSRIKTYENTYIITIDRKAPSKNVDTLVSNDEFVADYFGTTEVFENDMHKAGDKKVYTYQYKAYYESVKDLATDYSKIYAFKVNANTAFSRTDEGGETLAGLYVREYSDLTLPADKYAYTDASSLITSEDMYPTLTYKNIIDAYLTPTGSNYYEILEFDTSGNYSQYLIYYDNNADSFEITFKVSTSDKEEDNYVVDLLTANDDKTIYSIEKVSATNVGDRYYKIEIKKNNEVLTTIYTHYSYLFNGLSQTIADLINNNSYGNYYIVVTKRVVDAEKTKEETLTHLINYYDKNNTPELNVDNIYNATSKTINLAGANVVIDDILYYAKNVKVKCGATESIYYYELGNYYLSGDADKTPISYIACVENVTYIITLADTVGRTYTKRFSTGADEPYSWIAQQPESGESTSNNYEYSNNVYYTFTNIVFKYSLTFDSVHIKYETISKNVEYTFDNNGSADDNSREGILTWVKDSSTQYATATMLAQDDDVIKFTITITENEAYTFVIDRKFESTKLINATTGAEFVFGEGIDKPWKEVNASTASVGIFNLKIGKRESDVFQYNYVLHVQKQDNSYDTIDLNDKSSYVVTTSDEYTGVYKFEIQVYSKTELVYLGNKVYAFEVRKTNNQLYYVRDNEGNALKSNSTFTLAEAEIPEQTRTTKNVDDTILDAELPLYIINQNLSRDNNIVTIDDKVDIDAIYTKTELNKYTLTVYQVNVKDNNDSVSYRLYFGILYVKEQESIANDLKLKITNEVEKNVSGTITKTTETTERKVNSLEANEVIDGKTIELVATQNNSAWKNKNTLLLDIYYGDEYSFVTTKEYIYNSSNLDYLFEGDGSYHLQIRDLAGNIHTFEDESEYLSLFILREMTIYINDEVSVDSAYYNDQVKLRVYGASRYDTGSISISSTLNGKSYMPSYDGQYVYSAYGTYNVTATATYGGKAYSKTIQFTIINSKEAYKVFDLSVLSPYTITKVIAPNGDNVTTYFTTSIIEQNNLSGMVVDYDKLITDETLNLTGGKAKFEITYQTKEKYYPTRTIALSITFNNETALIECSLEPGESTKKGFEIKFNPGIIYDQIGEAYILINDQVVFTIDENSNYEVITQSRTYKADGDKDYYIKLTSSSGSVLNSFKVTIKEPLNSFAIIIIVTVTLIVAGVTITIIVLRNRMRIR